MKLTTTRVSVAVGLVLALVGVLFFLRAFEEMVGEGDEPQPIKMGDVSTRRDRTTVVVTVQDDGQVGLAYERMRDLFPEPGGYTVYVNCEYNDERLAEGTYAIGPAGAKATGLDDGDSTLERIDGATCSS